VDYEEENEKLSENLDSFKQLSRNKSDQTFLSELGYSSLEEYLKNHHTQAGRLIQNSKQRSLFDPKYDPAENRRIYLLELIEQRVKGFDAFEALDTTREKLDELLTEGAHSAIQYLIEKVPKGTLLSQFLYFVKGVSPHLLPLVWSIAGAWVSLTYLVLSIPAMKEKLWPHLVKVWSDFFHEANEKGYEATLAKLLRSLAKTYREAIEEYSIRLKNAESNDERAEILGELCASGYLKLTSASGNIRMVAAGGKGIAKVVGKGPGQKDILQGKLAKELEDLSEKLGPEKTAELVGKVEKKAEELAKAGGAAAKADNDIAKALAKDGQSRSPVTAAGKSGPGGSAELVADLEKQSIVREVKGGIQDSAGKNPATQTSITLAAGETESIFAENALGHIFHGEINKRGKAVGYHHESMMGGSILKVVRQTNPLGLYEAEIYVGGIAKDHPSTFFPKDWNRIKVLNSIKEAYGNKINVTRNKFRGTTSNGMEIEMYLDAQGKIITAYPKYK
jgi:hypothetical protein